MHIKIENLSFFYNGTSDSWEIKDLSLEINSGQIVGLLGPSGCGKSSLLGLIGGLLNPTKGKITIDGHFPCEFQGKIAYVFQTPRLLTWLTALQNVSLPLKLRTQQGKQNTTAISALKEVGLEDYLDAYPDQLSGGMAHRVAIARALITKPTLLLLDEPFASLDVFTRQQMQDLLRKIINELGLTIILVTHDLAEAAYLCNRIIIMGKTIPNIREDIAVKTSTGELSSNFSLISHLRTSIQNVALS